jgi:SMC interacting uncharacterized protein involved in chromosome segregation
MPLFRPLVCALALAAFAFPVRAEDEEEAKPKETPEEAFNAFKEAMKKKNGDAIWGFFSKSTRKTMVEQMGPTIDELREDEEKLAAFARKLGISAEDAKKMTDEDMARAAMLSEMNPENEEIDNVKWLGCKVNGKVAVCETKEGEEDMEKVVLVLEDGRWRLDLEKTEKLKNGEDEGDGGIEEEEEEGSGK